LFVFSADELVTGAVDGENVLRFVRRTLDSFVSASTKLSIVRVVGDSSYPQPGLRSARA